MAAHQAAIIAMDVQIIEATAIEETTVPVPVTAGMAEILAKTHVKMYAKRCVRRRAMGLTREMTRIVDAAGHFRTRPIRF